MPQAEEKQAQASLSPRTSEQVGTLTHRDKRRKEGQRADKQVKLPGMREQLEFHSEEHGSHCKVGERDVTWPTFWSRHSGFCFVPRLWKETEEGGVLVWRPLK